jgi:hypothetical protein
MVKTVRPKARATPSSPIPTLGKAAAKTALPHPPRTNQNVPTNSAPYCFILPLLSVEYSDFFSHSGVKFKNHDFRNKKKQGIIAIIRAIKFQTYNGSAVW